VNVGIYIEHGVGNGVGGAELAMAYLASVWSRDHDVDLIHHRPPLTRERLASFSSDDYSRVNIRYLPREAEPPGCGNPAARYRAASDWHREISAGYDLFVNCTHWLPCFSHARSSALFVLFPFYVRPGDSPEIRRLPFWKRARHAAYHTWEWRRRLATYDRRIAISEFTRGWTRGRWRVRCDVVYPPVDVAFNDGPKDPLVLSVGRFSTMAHTKKQLEMMQAFRPLAKTTLAGWTYACVGGLNDREENHRFFENVRAAGADCSTRVAANLDRPSIRALFERARIFWHATGLNDDTDARPELAEHFGISTVEAMAAGCVPVVINKGGQREIVRHGETGFLWDTVDELQHYTVRLATDTALWRRMSEAARAHARQFSRERFIDRMSTICGVPRSAGWYPERAPLGRATAL
jgi:glycosyltransferase involved in cell wall biosynthesis